MESVHTATYRRFESLSLRHSRNKTRLKSIRWVLFFPFDPPISPQLGTESAIIERSLNFKVLAVRVHNNPLTRRSGMFIPTKSGAEFTSRGYGADKSPNLPLVRR
jgi:hypothetical protein